MQTACLTKLQRSVKQKPWAAEPWAAAAHRSYTFFHDYPDHQDCDVSSNTNMKKLRNKLVLPGSQKLRGNVRGFVYLETRTRQVKHLLFGFLILRKKYCLLACSFFFDDKIYLTYIVRTESVNFDSTRSKC